MICALQTASVAAEDYTTITIPDSNEHSFSYWDTWDGIARIGSQPTLTVAGDVIHFLDSHLK